MLSFDKKFLFIHLPKTGGTSLKYLLKDYEERQLFDKYQSVFFDELKTQNWKSMSARLKDSLKSDNNDKWRDDIVKKFDKKLVDSSDNGKEKVCLYTYDQKLNPEYHEKMTLTNPNDAGYYHLSYNHYKELLDPDVFSSLTKFSIVRNPFDRAISLYFWNHELGEPLDKEKFLACVEGYSTTLYTCWNPQVWWLCDAEKQQINKGTEEDGMKKNVIILDDKNTVDFVLRFEENLTNRNISSLCNRLGVKYQTLPKLNASQTKKHYSYYYDAEMRAAVEKYYKADLDAFNYDFDKK
jgi:hypothetical protein